jgi:hypothetical protein
MKKLLILTSFLFPVFAFAYGDIQSLLTDIARNIKLFIPTIFMIGVIVFFYGLARFVLSAGDEETRTRAKNIMVYGVIAMFVMSSIWGIINFLGSALRIEPIEKISK